MPSTRGQAQKSNNTMEDKDSNQEPSKDSAETPPESEVSPPLTHTQFCFPLSSF